MHARFLAATEMLICPVVEGELLYGALGSARVGENLAQVTNLISLGQRMVLDHGIAAEYARLRNDLRVRGRMIPDNDIWIAACAIAEGATLVTRDAHFREVEGLAVEEW